MTTRRCESVSVLLSPTILLISREAHSTANDAMKAGSLHSIPAPVALVQINQAITDKQAHAIQSLVACVRATGKGKSPTDIILLPS
jgi:hypothetical protein